MRLVCFVSILCFLPATKEGNALTHANSSNLPHAQGEHVVHVPPAGPAVDPRRAAQAWARSPEADLLRRIYPPSLFHFMCTLLFHCHSMIDWTQP